MTTLYILPNPDDADPGFTDGEPVDPEGHVGPARWATVTPLRRKTVPGCPWCEAQPGGPWHDPSTRCLDTNKTHCTCGRCF
ncbi:hypothetical protein [Piscicoccus intestinalis]|uniref:hypothetical protein n=1 Tax=Piscicoccus intestinalis TaxID=746033 RepID=UPI0012EE3315|nr:hypothetical protein [Piscicoccus intestinalis]